MKSTRIPIIDHLRGIAAVSVAWFHLTNGYHDWVATTGANGWLGVEIFFVISGFVIPYSLFLEDYRFRAFPWFLLRRVLRLEPAYICSIGIVVALNFLAAAHPAFQGPPPNYSVGQILSHLFYFIPLTQFDWLQPVYWTLAWEFVFYLTIGFAFPFVGTSRSRWAGRSLAIGIALLVSLKLIPYLPGLFVMGFIVYRQVALNESATWTQPLLAANTIAMSLAGAPLEASIGLAAALLILLRKRAPSFAGPVGQAATALGTISYSLYLLHVPVGGKIVNFGSRFVHGAAGELVLSLVALLGSLAAAFVLYRLVESPSLALARRVHRPVNSRIPHASKLA